MYHQNNKTVKDNTDKNVADIDENNQTDSGVIVSETIDSFDDIEKSDTNNLNDKIKENSTSFDKVSSEINQNIDTKKIHEEMKPDSGFIDSIRDMNIKDDNVNKVGTLIDTQSKPFTEPILSSLKINNQHEQQSNEHWFCQNDDGDTQLHIAIIQGWETAALKLISFAPYPMLLDMKNDDGQTPLQLAVLTNQLNIVKNLILAGVDPIIRNINGDTALHLAVRANNIDLAVAITQSIETFGCINYTNFKIPLLQNLEQRNYQGLNCLHLAVENNSVDMVKFLVTLGADINSVEWISGKSSLHLAVEAGNKQIVTCLLRKYTPIIDLNLITYSGMTAYQIACLKDINIAEELTKYGAKPILFDYDSDDDDDHHHNDDDDSDDSDMEQNTSFVNDLKESQQRLVYT